VLKTYQRRVKREGDKERLIVFIVNDYYQIQKKKDLQCTIVELFS
jgi:hypothetical protein